ncbi:MAG: sigma-70 family RNA polymerase sigma factor [Stigonema ocellatum SAG 48.90 = DSM 106950]|nr:sigma-70 family RNA polymerase sigma factor [Stigonema ocellatum SAG 48.90 = DSM 106950]
MNHDSQDRDYALNEELQQLVKEAKRYSATSESPTDRAKRRIALNKLISTIQCSGRLSKQTQWSGLSNYEDYYNEALQQTFLEICQKIHQYNPQYPMMAWVNQIFNWRFKDVVKKEQKKGITLLPKNQENLHVLSLHDLNRELPIEHEIFQEEQLKEIIQNDPENFLVNEYIQEHPQASLKAILLLRLEGRKWKKISEELGIPPTTASSFYQRRLHKIITYLKKYI